MQRQRLQWDNDFKSREGIESAYAADSVVFTGKQWVVEKDPNRNWYAMFGGQRISRIQGGPAKPFENLHEAKQFCQIYEDRF